MRVPTIDEKTGQIHPHFIPPIKPEIVIDWNDGVGDTVQEIQLEIVAKGFVVAYKYDGTPVKFVSNGSLINMTTTTRYERFVGDFTYFRIKDNSGSNNEIKNITYRGQRNLTYLDTGRLSGLKVPNDMLVFNDLPSLYSFQSEWVKNVKKIVFSGNFPVLNYIGASYWSDLYSIESTSFLPSFAGASVHGSKMVSSANYSGGQTEWLEVWKNFIKNCPKSQPGGYAIWIYGNFNYSDDSVILQNWLNSNGYNWVIS